MVKSCKKYGKHPSRGRLKWSRSGICSDHEEKLWLDGSVVKKCNIYALWMKAVFRIRVKFLCGSGAQNRAGKGSILLQRRLTFPFFLSFFFGLRKIDPTVDWWIKNKIKWCVIVRAENDMYVDAGAKPTLWWSSNSIIIKYKTLTCPSLLKRSPACPYPKMRNSQMMSPMTI